MERAKKYLVMIVLAILIVLVAHSLAHSWRKHLGIVKGPNAPEMPKVENHEIVVHR